MSKFLEFGKLLSSSLIPLLCVMRLMILLKFVKILGCYSPYGIKSQSGKSTLEEMVGAGENFGNSEEIFGGNFWRKGLDFLVFLLLITNFS